jgi:hypothetical protein
MGCSCVASLVASLFASHHTCTLAHFGIARQKRRVWAVQLENGMVASGCADQEDKSAHYLHGESACSAQFG